MSENSGNKRHGRLVGVSLGARTTAEAEVALQEIARSADIAELRLDFMVEYDLPRLLRNRPCPVIVTNRPEREGGRFRGDEADRVKPLLAAIDLGAEYVDIEHDAMHLIPDRKQTKLIVSFHDFEKMPADFVQIHREIAAKGADVVKVVGMARHTTDNLPVFDALGQTSFPTIAIAMGEAGRISRILALRYDSCLLTYATLGNGEQVAPGQLAITTMHEVYQVEKIDQQTLVFGVLGQESPSNELLAALNLATREASVNGVWVPFIATGHPGDDPAEILGAYRRLDVQGYVVLGSTQSAASPPLDSVASPGPDGRVNVIKSVEGRLIGSWAPSLVDAFTAITGHPGNFLNVRARL